MGVGADLFRTSQLAPSCPLLVTSHLIHAIELTSTPLSHTKPSFGAASAAGALQHPCEPPPDPRRAPADGAGTAPYRELIGGKGSDSKYCGSRALNKTFSLSPLQSYPQTEQQQNLSPTVGSHRREGMHALEHTSKHQSP